MGTGWILFAGLASLAACGVQPDGASSDTLAPISSDDRGVAVVVAGTLSPDGALCPGEELECPYGVAVDGAIGDVSAGDFVAGRGWYDGRRLLLAAPLTRRDPIGPQDGDAEFSQQQLLDANARIGEMVEQGMFAVQGGYSLDEGINRIVVPIEAIDAAGRAALDELEAVVVVPFIELLDRPLSDLPTWRSAVEGTVDLLTTASRMRGGMDALGTFNIQYDATANCLYAELDGRRSTFVWPFGYSATESNGVVTVFNARGAAVAAAGETIQMGGGGGDAIVLAVTGDNRCDADMFWFVNDG